MATNSAHQICLICDEKVSDLRRCPHLFRCSHCFCSSCTNQLITSNSRACPVCKTSFHPASIIGIEKSTNPASTKKLLVIAERKSGLLTSFATIRKQQLSSSKFANSSSNSSRCSLSQFVKDTDDLRRKDLTCYQITGEDIYSSIQANNKLGKQIHQVNLEIKLSLESKTREIVNINEKILRQLEKKNKKLKANFQEVQETKRRIRVLGEKFQSVTNFKESSPVIDETRELHGDVQMWLEELKDTLANEKSTMLDLQRNTREMMQNIDKVAEILTSVERGCKEIDIDDEEIYCKGNYIEPIIRTVKDISSALMTIDDLRDMKPLAKSLLLQGRLFAMQTQKGRRRHARLSISEDNQLLLGYLQDSALPPNAHVLQYNDVMTLSDSSSYLVFLELSDIRIKLGKMYIRLFSMAKRKTNQFLLLCTGEMGPSYANTRLLQVGNKGHEKLEFVRFGDYEKNDGTGGRPILPKCKYDDEDKQETPCLAGIVGGVIREEERIGGQFMIRTRDNHTRNCSPSLGRIKKGLTILNRAISCYSNIRDVHISECGIVLVDLNAYETVKGLNHYSKTA